MLLLHNLVLLNKRITRIVVFVFNNMFVLLFYSNTMLTVIALNKHYNFARLKPCFCFFLSIAVFLCPSVIKI